METNDQDAREARGRQLASVASIKRAGHRWVVPSQTSPAQRYLVDLVDAECTCPDFELRKGTCKHQHAVWFWIAWGRDVGADGAVTETATVTVKRKTYPQKNWSAYNASQHHEREYVERLLRALCASIVQPPRKPGAGRNPRLLSDLVFSAVMKVYTQLSGRRVRSDLEASAAKGLLNHVGHENCMFDFLGREATTPLLVALVEQSAAPMAMIENGQYAIDSTGFSTVTYDRWFDQKHGKLNAQHPWIKLHAMAGTVTHAITGVKVSSEGDAPQLPELLAQTMKHHNVKQLSGDKAYASVKNHEALEAFGVEAFIPFKENAVFNPKSEVWSRHLFEFLLNQDKFLPNYHRRSNVETVFSMMKMRFGGSLSSRRPTAQVNETLTKCLAHNLCCFVKAIFMSGLAPTFWPDAPAVAEAA